MQYLSQAHHIVVMQMGGKIGIHGAYETILNDPLLPKNMFVAISPIVTTGIISDRNNNEEESKQKHKVDVVVYNTRHALECYCENIVENGDGMGSGIVKVIILYKFYSQ